MLTANANPQNTNSGSVIIKSCNKRHILVNTTGKRTALGEYYEQNSSNELPVGGFDPTQAPYTEGNTEFIKMRSGEERAARRYDAADNDYKLTKLGKSFYSRLKRNYVVQIPVKVKGKRKDGPYYNIKSTLPISNMRVDRIEMPLNLTAAQRTAKIKEIISAKLNLDEPLYEVSQEEWVYDRDAQGSWVINEESVAIIDPDTQETIIAQDRRVGTMPYLLFQIAFSEDIIPEAFQDSNDMCCVPRQLSAFLGLDFGLICNEMSEIELKLYGESKWWDKGCTPRMVIEFCKQRNMGACIMHNGNVLESLAGQNPIVAALHENHLYFYKAMKTRNKLMTWKTQDEKYKHGRGIKLKRDHMPNATTPAASEWRPFAHKIEPGHFYTTEEDIATVRAWFLESRRCPRIALKDMNAIRSLTYNCTKIDTVKGSMTIHAMLQYHREIMEWLKFLPVKVKYTGSGLPNIAAQVLLLMIKHCRQRNT